MAVEASHEAATPIGSSPPNPTGQVAPSEFDPITAEVIRSSFDNIASEMSLVLLRTSGSPVLTES